MRRFTLEELQRYDGREGRPSYIACKGRVYDVSNSFLWKEGVHQVSHRAGQDLTQALQEAPHGDDLLEKFPVVGVLADSDVQL